MAETSKSYDNSRNALNDQINAIAGDLEAQKNRINAQYAQQGKTLDNQRNYQAQASSMAASRNGGSFGGSAEIANKKYYQQAYVPAVTQLQTNQANDLSSAESQANQNRLSLQQTLASLNDEANRYALQRYDAAQAAEREEAYRQKQLELQRQQLAGQQRQFNQQLAAQNAMYKYLNQPTTAQKYGVDADLSRDGQIYYKNNNTGASVRFGTYANSLGGNYKGLLQKAAATGDNDAADVMKFLNDNPNSTISYMGGGGKQYYENNGLGSALNRLGIIVSGYPR
jgi:hypothetical protein